MIGPLSSFPDECLAGRAIIVGSGPVGIALARASLTGRPQVDRHDEAWEQVYLETLAGNPPPAFRRKP